VAGDQPARGPERGGVSPAIPTDSVLVIRADADSQVGTGHVMRCLALAQAWQDGGGRALFLMAPAPPALESRLRSAEMEVLPLHTAPGTPEDAAETAALALSHGASWVVADGYHFGAEYQHRIKDAGLRLLVVDDYGHASHYCADLVLNQNIGASEELYSSREQHTRLLLGARYALLRREFWPWRSWRREIPEVARKVLVTLGGGDPDNVTLKVVQALAQVEIEGLEAVVIVGAANPHLEQLRAAVKDLPHFLGLRYNVTNMPELMAWADMAITAGGSTCWELAFMQIPAIVLILAGNQEPVARRLEEIGAVLNLGWPSRLSAAGISRVLANLLMSPTMRQDLARQTQSLVDGQGTTRVLRQLI
jgi:UDP-2,4-diacetamido-2,4,6-trideoxy-beta-L-altropyranose hydrolase